MTDRNPLLEKAEQQASQEDSLCGVTDLMRGRVTPGDHIQKRIDAILTLSNLGGLIAKVIEGARNETIEDCARVARQTGADHCSDDSGEFWIVNKVEEAIRALKDKNPREE